MSRPLPRPRLGAPLLLCAVLAAGDARALWDDRAELFASYAAYHDDNVLRQPPGAGTQADRYSVSSIGLSLDAPFARQRLLGSLTLNRVRYDRFEQYDVDGDDGHLQWQWRPGEDTGARAGLAHRRALASLANVQDGEQSFVPNVLTTRQAYADLRLGLASRWQATLEAAALEQRNAALERTVNDLDLDSGGAELSYAGKAGHRLGLRVRAARGAMPNAQPVAGQRVDNSYRQREAGVTAGWDPGAKLRLRAYLGRVQREYRQLPERDFEDGTWELAADWTPTGRLELTALAQRAISATEEINVSFVFATRARLAAKYRLGAKSELLAALESSEREYLGEAAQVLGTAPPRTERVRAAGLAIAYRPWRRVTLTASLRREQRDADAAGADYWLNVVSLGARVGF